MEITRYDVIKIIDFVRNNIFKQEELNSLLEVDLEYESEDLILGISNEFLSDFAEMISGHKIKVVGEVEELYVCPCCKYRTLTEPFDIEAGTGYDVCPLCGWEDDGTTDADQYRSINRGSMADYRKRLAQNSIGNKWRMC